MSGIALKSVTYHGTGSLFYLTTFFTPSPRAFRMTAGSALNCCSSLPRAVVHALEFSVLQLMLGFHLLHLKMGVETFFFVCNKDVIHSTSKFHELSDQTGSD
jgi:hypothetical protein